MMEKHVEKSMQVQMEAGLIWVVVKIMVPFWMLIIYGT